MTAMTIAYLPPVEQKIRPRTNSLNVKRKKGKGASKSTSTTRSGQDSRKSPKTSPNGEENSLFWYGFTENVIQGLSSLPETVGNLWMNVFDTVSRAYHQKIAKDRANEEGSS